jgi:FKBP-type peptidyl-prolyl cis-trans isomerase (trigger factor)
VYDLQRDEARIIPVHFPAHHEVGFYRGKRRLIRVTLNDVKPLGWAPTLEDDVLRGLQGGSAMRAADYSQAQLRGMAEAAHG